MWTDPALADWLDATDPAARDPFGFTPLHVAVLRGEAAVRDALLAAGADPKAKTAAMASGSPESQYVRPEGATIYASKARHPHLRAHEIFDKGATPLHLAAAAGDTEAVAALLAHKALPTKDGVGATPLHLAAQAGHPDVVRQLLDAGVKVDAATRVRKSLRFHDTGCTALHGALESGDATCVRLLLNAGADPTATTAIGCSGVFFAARGGSVESLDALGLPVDGAVGYLDWPLLEAVERGHVAMVRRLLAGGAVTEDGRNQAPLRAAIAAQHAELRAVLLEGGARPVQHSSVAMAARSNDTWAIEAAVAAGADPSAAESGMTPLMHAASQGYVAATRTLLALSADPDVVAQYTALGVALANGHWPVVDLLLEAGVDCAMQDAYGHDGLADLVFRRGVTPGRVARALALGGNPHRRSRRGSCVLDGLDRLPPAIADLLRDVPPPGDADAAVWRDADRSVVLASADGTERWQDLHTRLWDELVPPSGAAPTLQGELVRCSGRLSDEAYRNGNINWGPMHEGFVDTLERHLLDGTLGAEREADLRRQLRAVRGPRSPDLGPNAPYRGVAEAVVRWCLAHRALVPRP